jgi:hypothetical protein
MITTETFRRTEQMLLAASNILPADVMISVIALAVEYSPILSIDPGSAAASAIRFPLSALADRLGQDRRTAGRWARSAGGEIRNYFDLNFVRFELDGTSFDIEEIALEELPSVMVVVEGFSTILRGIGLCPVIAEDEQSVPPDEASRAAIELVGRIAATGSTTSLLLRLEGGARDRSSDVLAASRMISGGLDRSAPVYGDDGGDRSNSVLTPAAIVLMAVLHAVDPVVIIGQDILKPEVGDPEDDFDELPRSLPLHRSLSETGEALVGILPFATATVLVAVPQDVVLHPDRARLFATAIGPLRSDRMALVETMRIASGRGLSEPVAVRLVGIWNGDASRARAILDTSARIIDASEAERGTINRVATDPIVYNALVTALATGIAPHVHTASPYRSKKRSETFFRELFVTNPPAVELFETLSVGQPRLIMHGIPGTGKSAAAGYIAATVFKMNTMEIRSADVLFHRLGHLEKAIAKAFREAKRADAVLVFDEAEALAQNRSTTSQGNAHLATAMTNALLVELDDHEPPIIFATNHLERIDPAIIRRADVVAEVLPIPQDLEPLAVELTLGFCLPNSMHGFGSGTTVISDYAAARKAQLLRALDLEQLLAIILKARDNRLGEAGDKKKFGFLQAREPTLREVWTRS